MRYKYTRNQIIQLMYTKYMDGAYECMNCKIPVPEESLELCPIHSVQLETFNLVSFLIDRKKSDPRQEKEL